MPRDTNTYGATWSLKDSWIRSPNAVSGRGVCSLRSRVQRIWKASFGGTFGWLWRNQERSHCHVTSWQASCHSYLRVVMIIVTQWTCPTNGLMGLFFQCCSCLGIIVFLWWPLESTRKDSTLLYGPTLNIWCVQCLPKEREGGNGTHRWQTGAEWISCRNSLENFMGSIGTASLQTEFKGLFGGIHLLISKLVWNSGKP